MKLSLSSNKIDMLDISKSFQNYIISYISLETILHFLQLMDAW